MHWEEVAKKNGRLYCQKQDTWCCYTNHDTGGCMRDICISQKDNLKLLIGGSPCTHWSIAQTKNRETEPSGMGWELFLNYLIAREKFKPNYFLYENNKSISAAIQAQITKELGVEPVLINSALVSAQNRQRLYWVGKKNQDGTYSQLEISQPRDKGIMLSDILENGIPYREKGYTLKGNYAKTSIANAMDSGHFPATMVAEPVNVTAEGKAQCIRATCYKDGIRNMVGNTVDRRTCVAERIGTIEHAARNQEHDSKQYRVYSTEGKSTTLCGNGGGIGAKTGLYAVPVAGRIVGRRIGKDGKRDDYNKNIKNIQKPEVNNDPTKTNCITTVGKDNVVITPLNYPPSDNPKAEVTLFHPPGGWSKGEIKYDKVPTITASRWEEKYFVLETADGKTYPVYRVEQGQIIIKSKQYPIKLADGFYIIRKLTVTECKRLQTVPDSYNLPVSNTQSYKMLGNGWTVDVIAHILSHIPEIKMWEVEVLSMYDGMSCGHIALDKLGAKVARYYATEIDKYAIETTKANYPKTVFLGDANGVREEGWNYKKHEDENEKVR